MHARQVEVIHERGIRSFDDILCQALVRVRIYGLHVIVEWPAFALHLPDPLRELPQKLSLQVLRDVEHPVDVRLGDLGPQKWSTV